MGAATYKVEIIAYDDAYKSNEAVTAANRSWCRGQGKIHCRDSRVRTHLSNSTDHREKRCDNPNTGFYVQGVDARKAIYLRPNLTTGEISQPQIDWVVKSQGLKTVGALFRNDETGQQIAKDVAKAYKNAGAEMTTEFFGRERVDFVPLLTKLLARRRRCH